MFLTINPKSFFSNIPLSATSSSNQPGLHRGPGRNQSLGITFPPGPVRQRRSGSGRPGRAAVMADTAAPPAAAPAPGLPAAPGSNPLSRKLNKILETRLDNDKVGRAAAEAGGGGGPGLGAGACLAGSCLRRRGRMSRQGLRAPIGSGAGQRAQAQPQFRCGAAS